MSDLIQYIMENYNVNLSENLRDADSTERFDALHTIHMHLPNVDVTRVCVVNNVFLKGMYELKKEEYQSRYGSVTQMTVIHATSESNVNSIIRNNFDWRRVSRSKYGIGVSFSGDADYANYHCNRNNGYARAFIIAKMLIHSSCYGSQHLKVPSGKADTAKSVNGKVYVKFNDNEFMPLYVVYYNAPSTTTSKFYQVRSRHFYF